MHVKRARSGRLNAWSDAKLGAVVAAYQRRAPALSPSESSIFAVCRRETVRREQIRRSAPVSPPLAPPTYDLVYDPFAPDTERVLKAVTRAVEVECTSFVTPAGLATALMPHQRIGVAWMVAQEAGACAGGVLADEMGLGKTLMTIAAVLTDAGGGPTLVVTPNSVLKQWQREFAQHAPGALAVGEYHGPRRLLGDAPVVVTTYGTLVSDHARGSSGLFARTWRRVVLDEAHCIRNARTATARAAMQLHAERRWCLTGTPVNNTPEDFRTLLAFLRHPAGDVGEWNRRTAGDLVSAFADIAAGVMLRRRKTTLLNDRPIVDLPPHTIQVMSVDFRDAEERAFYDSHWAESRSAYREMANAKTVSRNMVLLLTILLRLRMACSHPWLFRRSLADVEDMIDPREATLRAQPAIACASTACVVCGDVESRVFAPPCGHVHCAACALRSADDAGACPACAAPIVLSVLRPAQDGSAVHRGVHARVEDRGYESTKIAAAMQCIREAWSRPGSKIVVVSQWTGMLDLLAERCRAECIHAVTYCGKMSPNEREAAIGAFAAHVDVLLLSLKAGGTGLNLTMADTMFVLEPWYNPQAVLQVVDRVKRIGQTRPVTIVRIIMRGTIEERVLAIERAKADVAASMLGDGKVASAGLTTADMAALFQM